MKFLSASTDAPRARDCKRQMLATVSPYESEYRIYFNHRDEERTDSMMMGEDTEEPQTVLVPTADFVAVQADHEPTDEEWRMVLAEQGYTEEQITAILSE